MIPIVGVTLASLFIGHARDHCVQESLFQRPTHFGLPKAPPAAASSSAVIDTSPSDRVPRSHGGISTPRLDDHLARRQLNAAVRPRCLVRADEEIDRGNSPLIAPRPIQGGVSRPLCIERLCSSMRVEIALRSGRVPQPARTGRRPATRMGLRGWRRYSRHRSASQGSPQMSIGTLSIILGLTMVSPRNRARWLA
jgi:hypothetical protein